MIAITDSSFLNPNQISEIDRLIQQLRNKFNGDHKLVLSVMSRTKKNQQKFYNDASFLQREINLSSLEVEELIDKKLLKFVSKKEERLTLTLKGILMAEYGITNPSKEMNEMLDDFNDEFFEKIMGLSEEQLSSQEKAIVIALLGLCALSDQYLLKVDEKNEKYFREAVDRAVKFIKDLEPELVDKDLDSIWTRNVVGEGPVLGLWRRLNKIPFHTEGIYKKHRDGHYLEILTNNKVEETKFAYLLSRLFNKVPLTFDKKKELIKTLDEIHRYEYKIFKNNPPFDVLEVRKQMKRLIESI